MTDDHEFYAEWAAASTLGTLDADDRHSFERHLASCSICAQNVASFAPLRALMAKVDQGDIDASPDLALASSIETAARQHLATMKRDTRRWRRAALLDSAAAVVACGLFVGSSNVTDDGSVEVAATVLTDQTDSASIGWTAKSWGTQISVDLTGLPARDNYQLWAIDNDGGWSSAATWSANADGTARLIGTTATLATEIERIVVTSVDKNDVLVSADP